MSSRNSYQNYFFSTIAGADLFDREHAGEPVLAPIAADMARLAPAARKAIRSLVAYPPRYRPRRRPRLGMWRLQYYRSIKDSNPLEIDFMTQWFKSFLILST